MLLTSLARTFGKTIADFRRANRKAIRNVSREFTLFCRQLELFSGDLVASDGSKFKAVNRRDRNFTKKQLKRLIQKLDEDIDRYLEEMDEADEEEPEEKKLTAEELQQKIEEMKRRRAEAEMLRKKLDESGQSQISLTDPDSRMMPVSGGRRTDVAYNVQLSVDPKHKLIIDHEVTNAVTDRDLLSRMAKRVKDLLGVDDLEVLADMGYREACCALPRQGGESLFGGWHHALYPQAPSFRQPQTWSLQQRRLPIRPRTGLLLVPRRGEADVPLPHHRKGQRHQILCHQRVCSMSHENSVHPQQRRPPHHSLGGRGPAG